MNENSFDSIVNRINNLENELNSLKREVEILKSTTNEVPVAQSPVQVMPQPVQPVTVPQPQPVQANAVPPQPMQPVAVSQPVQTNVVPQSQPVPAKVKQKTSVENKIGKNLMGIVAAILVFAAFIVFGGLIYEYIPDIVKVIVMYGISFAFSFVGIKNMRKESKYRVLFSSIAATGVCAVYIATLIAYFAFNLLPAPVLIGIIIAWLVVTGILSKSKSKMFMYICNVGLVISTILVAADWDAFYFAAILYILGLAFIYLLNRSNSYNKDCHVYMQLSFVAMILSVANEDNFIYSLILYVVVTAILFVREFLYEIDLRKLATYIISTVIWLIYTAVFTSICDKQSFIGDYSTFVFVAAVTLFMIVYNVKHKALSKAFSYALYYFWAFTLILLNVGFITEYLSFSLIALGFIIAGCITRKIRFWIPGYFYLFLFLCASPNVLEDDVNSLIVLGISIAL